MKRGLSGCRGRKRQGTRAKARRRLFRAPQTVSPCAPAIEKRLIRVVIFISSPRLGSFVFGLFRSKKASAMAISSDLG